MPDNNLSSSALEQALIAPEPVANPNLEPLPASSNSKAAIRRCRAAWKRAFDIYIESEGDNFFTRKGAAENANPVYCAAMPVLDSPENIRDFIACTAHGILIGAIPAERSGQLLYAAQVALSFHQFQAKASKEPKKRRTPPPPPKKQPRSEPESDSS
jgi:hypothetical protein